MKADRHLALPGRKRDNTVFPCNWTVSHVILFVRLFSLSGILTDVRKCDEIGKSLFGKIAALLVDCLPFSPTVKLRRHVPQKILLAFDVIYGVMFQKIELFIFRRLNFTYYLLSLIKIQKTLL
jgi:hypothetical protein